MNSDHHLNPLRQPVSYEVENWTEPDRPAPKPMEGVHCRLEPLDVGRHAAALFDAYAQDREGRIWTYLPYGPFDSEDDLRQWIQAVASKDDPQFYAVVDRATGSAAGVASYLRIDPANGSVEVGHINYAPRLQRTVAATEAMYLMMKRVFELGYRRYEWKCDALNGASRRAAERLGFVFEGVFRQSTMYKGRNRDTAWYAVIDKDWPALSAAFLAWLQSENFDDSGRQRRSLGEFRQALS